MDSLTLDHIRKCYGPNTILDNLTYSFPLKEVSVILGKSGCGKTTLLRLIMGLEKAEGKILKSPHPSSWHDVSGSKAHALFDPPG